MKDPLIISRSRTLLHFAGLLPAELYSTLGPGLQVPHGWEELVASIWTWPRVVHHFGKSHCQWQCLHSNFHGTHPCHRDSPCRYTRLATVLSSTVRPKHLSLKSIPFYFRRLFFYVTVRASCWFFFFPKRCVDRLCFLWISFQNEKRSIKKFLRCYLMLRYIWGPQSYVWFLQIQLLHNETWTQKTFSTFLIKPSLWCLLNNFKNVAGPQWPMCIQKLISTTWPCGLTRGFLPPLGRTPAHRNPHAYNQLALCASFSTQGRKKLIP